MNQRLQQFLSAENISQAQFADTIEVARASVSHVLSGRNKPGYEFIKSITDHYPKLSLDWLINGKGKMYKQDSPIPATNEAPVHTAETNPAAIEKKSEEGFNGQLFAPEEEENPDTVSAPTLSSAISDKNKTSNQPKETTINQRNITKIVVFYDDNTYQELK